MTPKRLTIAAIVAVLAAAPGLVPTASAAHDDFVFGAGVRVGGFELNLGYVPTRHGPPTYYYATHDRIHYDDYRCTDRCYRRGGTYYHHERCPALLHLLHSHRVHPHRLYAGYAPRYDGRWSRYDPYAWDRGYRSDHHHRFDRHHRHDRRDRGYRRHGEYRRHGQYRRHGRYDDRHWRDRRPDHHRRDHDRGRHDRGRGRGHDRH